MLNVEISKDGFTIKGHAEFAEYGKDIVCAAVSFLAQTVALRIDDSSMHTEPGMMDLKIHAESTESKILLEYFEYAVQLLAVQYPKNVRIKKI